MSGTTILALVAMATLPQTDTVVSLDGADRLAVEARVGSITVTAWNRPDVHIQADHGDGTRVEVSRRGSTLEVESEGRGGAVRYTIRVPPSLHLDLEGFSTRIVVEGVEGEVSAETHQGDIRIAGGRGRVAVSSLAGEVVVEGARGRIDLDLVGGGARVMDSEGEIWAESVGGSLVFENVRARMIEAESVGGRIVYDGELQSGGRYFFGSHGGSVTLRVPGTVGASFHLVTVHGRVHSDLPGAPESFRGGGPHDFRLGDGGAVVEVETFGGSISLVGRNVGAEAPVQLFPGPARPGMGMVSGPASTLPTRSSSWRPSTTARPSSTSGT